MDEIKSAVLVGCMLGIAFSIIKTYIHDKKVYKNVRMLMSLVLIVTVVMPFLKGEVEISLPASSEVTQTDNEFLNSELEKAYIHQIENSLCDNLMLYFKKEKIDVKKLVIQTKVDEYNFLEVDKVEVYTDTNNQSIVKDIVCEHLGDKVNLEFYDEE